MCEEFYPKKRLGQTFLVDRNILEKVASCIPYDYILEVGSGRGEVTQYLIGKVKFLWAVEIDPQLINILEEKFKDFQNIKVINEDILKLDLFSVFKEASEHKIFVFGNVPFYISTHLIIKFIKEIDFLRGVLITVQKEVARKIIASPGKKDYGFLAVLTEIFFFKKLLFNIKKTSFSPSPRVDSSLLELIPKDTHMEHLDKFIRFLRVIFNERRKKMANALKAFLGKNAPIEKILGRVNLDSSLRPEVIPPEKFRELFFEVLSFLN